MGEVVGPFFIEVVGWVTEFKLGMMNEAYFVGRGELLHWINNLLQLNYSKVEQCCSGLRLFPYCLVAYGL